MPSADGGATDDFLPPVEGFASVTVAAVGEVAAVNTAGSFDRIPPFFTVFFTTMGATKGNSFRRSRAIMVNVSKFV